MRVRALRCLVLSAALVCSAASGQGYPARPVTIVVPFPAGGPTDTIARIMGERMGRALGQSVVVENTTGAGGSIGVGRVVRAAPDGYLVSIGHIGTHVLNGVIYALPYDLLKDLEPVAMIATNPQVIVAKTALPARDLGELIAWAKASGDRVSIGTGGIGTPSHLSAIYFKQLTGDQGQLIHYRGGAPANQALFAGQIDVFFDQAVTALPNSKGGRVKAYAVTAKTRLAAAPDIPTVDEAGLPGYYMAVWHGLWLPKATPKGIVARLNASVVETLADATVRERLGGLGQEIPLRAQQTPEALAAHHRAEIEKWWPLVRAAGIKPE
jgi:tripartite-type tricarboxylate transporter receptor subunit TctC